MILIFSSQTTPRLEYILTELIEHRLGVHYELTSQAERFRAFQGPKINYSNLPFDNCLHIQPVKLLFEDIITAQDFTVTDEKWWLKKFYDSKGHIPFDVFAASFYLLSRYEEYTSDAADHHGRFSHKSSCAYQHGFLQTPLVDNWAIQLKWELENKLNYHSFSLPSFRFISTIDIDFAYRYRGIGFIRYWMKFLNSLTHFDFFNAIEQLNVGTTYKNDPYDTYKFIEKICADNKCELMYFILLSTGTAYDKNIIPHHAVMEKLVERLAEKTLMGLHPSYYTAENPDLLLHEKQLLETYLQIPVLHSRQHFLRYRLPETLEQLETIGIRNDYSVGYSAVPGFRASTSHTFTFFNLRKNKPGALLLHPVSVMDVNFKNNPVYQPISAYKEIEKMMGEVKKVNGTFISIWHNSNLSHHEGWKPWKEVFQKIHTLAASKANQEID